MKRQCVWFHWCLCNYKKMKGKKQTRIFDSRCQNSFFRQSEHFQATRALKIICPMKDTYTQQTKYYTGILYFHVTSLTCVINDYNTSETFESLPNKFSKQLYETFLLPPTRDQYIANLSPYQKGYRLLNLRGIKTLAPYYIKPEIEKYSE